MVNPLERRFLKLFVAVIICPVARSIDVTVIPGLFPDNQQELGNGAERKTILVLEIISYSN